MLRFISGPNVISALVSGSEKLEANARFGKQVARVVKRVAGSTEILVNPIIVTFLAK